MPTAHRKKCLKPPGCRHATLVSTLGVTQREPSHPPPPLKNPSYAPEYSYLPS